MSVMLLMPFITYDTNDGADETYFIDPRDFILASDAIEAFIW